MVDTILLQADRLREVLVSLFEFHGCASCEATLIARHLVDADLYGHPSHGVGLVPTYIANIQKGEVIPNRKLGRVPLAGGFLLFDGGSGFGQSLGAQLVEQVLAHSADTGIAVFGLRHVHHLGRIGDYGERLAEHGLVSVLFVNTVSRPIVAPFGGAEPRMGTNPVCITMPRPGARPVVLDFATSAIAVGKCRVALERGEPIPPGVAIDAQGDPTTDPGVLYSSPQGALLAMGGYKGSGINLMCELLAASIGGRTMEDARPGSGSAINNLVGMSFQAAAVPGAVEEVDSAIRYFLATRPSGHGKSVRLPGTPEQESYGRLSRAGLQLAHATWTAIASLAQAAAIADEEIQAVTLAGSGIQCPE
jgi:uncharacterized oxidoreductase